MSNVGCIFGSRSGSYSYEYKVSSVGQWYDIGRHELTELLSNNRNVLSKITDFLLLEPQGLLMNRIVSPHYYASGQQYQPEKSISCRKVSSFFLSVVPVLFLIDSCRYGFEESVLRGAFQMQLYMYTLVGLYLFFARYCC